MNAHPSQSTSLCSISRLPLFKRVNSKFSFSMIPLWTQGPSHPSHSELVHSFKHEFNFFNFKDPSRTNSLLENDAHLPRSSVTFLVPTPHGCCRHQRINSFHLQRLHLSPCFIALWNFQRLPSILPFELLASSSISYTASLADTIKYSLTHLVPFDGTSQISQIYHYSIKILPLPFSLRYQSMSSFVPWTRD